MTLKTYQAESVNTALEEIQRDFGDDALIVHSRTFRRGGLFGFGGRQVVEITVRSRRDVHTRPANPTRVAFPPASAAPVAALAPRATAAERAVGEPRTAPIPRRGTLATVRAAESNRSGDVTPDIQAPSVGPLSTVSAPPPAEPVSAQRNPDGPAAGTAPNSERGGAAPPPSGTLNPEAIDRIVDRVLAARRQRQAEQGAAPVDALQGATATESTATSAAGSPSNPRRLRGHLESARVGGDALECGQPVAAGPPDIISPALEGVLAQLLAQDVAPDLARRICAAVQVGLNADVRDARSKPVVDAATVRQRALQEIAARIAVTDPDDRPMRARDGRPRTMALVGPTGVGKTTTIAKLAAAYKLQHQASVGLIAADTYRIAAVEQLQVYAEIVGLPLLVVDGPEAMAEACGELSDCDVVLIDTAGRAPRDAERLQEVSSMLAAAMPHEVHLVLSCASSERAMRHAVERFRGVGAEHLIFTKVDEALTLGVILNVLDQVAARVSFVTTGQEVPDHVAPASSMGLAERILGVSAGQVASQFERPD